MPFGPVKLKKANAPTRLAFFDAQPSWGDLASKIADLFSMSPKNVSVNFVDQAKDVVVSLTNEQELHEYFDQSSGEIKFVVQDLQTPDPLTTITSTWSPDKLRVFCWVLNVSDNPFSVDIGKSMTVGYLKEKIKKEKKLAFNPDTLKLWKLSSPIPFAEIGTKLRHIQSPQGILGCVELDAVDELSEHFYSASCKHLHIIVDVPPKPSLKHSRSPSARGDGEAKKKRSLPFRRWAVDGGITENDANERYYVDPGTQDVTSLCLNAVSEGTYLLLGGARASGKSTRLFWLRQKLEAMGYWALYITFETLLYRGSIKVFWGSFGKAIDLAAARCGRGLPKGCTTPISSAIGFISYFRKDYWDGKVVLLLDELSCLYQCEEDVRNDCLIAFRALKHYRRDHAVQCLIAAGTFGIVHLNTSRGPPFNVAEFVQSPYFTIDETRKLFREFAEDLGVSIDDAIVEDVWAKSNGHPGMVCLCGRIIDNNMQTLLCPQSWTISYYRWQRFPAEQLYDEISRYDAYYYMIESLSRVEASSSVSLLRSLFAGFLGDETLTDPNMEKDANTLTSEGVLLKPDYVRPCYRMASPLVDGLIRNQLIPARFRNAPSSPLPLQHTGDIDVLGILIESLKFFDKALILMASYCSCKAPKVKIRGGRVPRESVYDTELMRILANWLRKYGWSVNVQWHLEDDLKRHMYSDIVLKKDQLTIVLELLATGEPSAVESHIQKTPEHAALLSASEAWVVHFTRQEDYHPIWQSDMELSKNINVVHFAHDLEFTNVVMSARWKDCAGEIRREVGKSLSLD
ncbi:hypothetical protein F5887DRAFT_1072145 [Amanita rubescens]|nr:hypothetical protein F5887DRAFT_1072145 [Amanita rubescens]